mmetsp:Transcript_578/g.652  ORF Transcript_578/g.652 Transcript_578/m.652 type:complete len:167 (+) Transcript_578:1942-2442(+)
MATKSIGPPTSRGKTSSDRETKCKCKNSPVLIVDDDVFNIMTLKMMIKGKFKLEPESASNGQEAFETFKNRLLAQSTRKNCESGCMRGFFHLIFMDLNMPIKDGFEATKEILQFEEQHHRAMEAKGITGIPRCKVIALTAFIGEKNLNHCMEVGMHQVLNKPANIK